MIAYIYICVYKRTTRGSQAVAIAPAAVLLLPMLTPPRLCQHLESIYICVSISLYTYIYMYMYSFYTPVYIYIYEYIYVHIYI